MTQSNLIKIGSYTYAEADCIGKGSFGKVYKGKNAQGGIVAIKIIYVENNKQSTLIKMIKNEVEALKKARSEYIVQFMECIVQNNHVYIITEYCNQKDLRHYLTKYKILDEPKAVEFLKQIVAAFKEMCRRQIFHRDLKPANVLLHNGICKIADFGFAKTLDFSVTDYTAQMVSIVGTPLYMSPQLLDKQKYTTKSDIWSLGIIFYEMLFGRVPWEGKDPATYSKNIKSQPLTFMYDVNSISPEAEDFMTQCLKVSEDERIGWTELFNHPLLNDAGIGSARSTKEDSTDADFAEFLTAESRVKNYCRRPVNPSMLMKTYQDKALAASKAITASQLEMTKTTIDQKLKYITQLGLTQSMMGGKTMIANTPHSRTFNMSMLNDEKNDKTLNRLKSNYLLNNSREISPSPDARGGKSSSIVKKFSDETAEEFKKIETPLLIMRNKLIVLTDVHTTVTSCEEFKELPAVKFNFLITISKLINVIFKALSAQVLTGKIKTRSHLLQDYIDTDNFKRLVVFAETNKKRYEDMLKVCSRKLFELVLPSDKEKDEVLDYYQEILAEVEEQVLLGKLVDISNQMLYQIRFSSQINKRSVGGTTHVLESYNPNAVTKEYFEGLLALFGEESIIDTFKYDKIDEVISKVEKLKEETRIRM